MQTEDITTVEDFAALVTQMREAQNKFFQDRTKTSLRIAKLLESRVDSICKQYAPCLIHT